MYDQPSILSDTLLKIINSGKYFSSRRRGLAMRQKCLWSIWNLLVSKKLIFLLRINFASAYHKYMLLENLCQTPFFKCLFSHNLCKSCLRKIENKNTKIVFFLFSEHQTRLFLTSNSSTKLSLLVCSSSCEFIVSCEKEIGNYFPRCISWGRG